MEKFFIRTLDARNPEIGYNIAAGGGGALGVKQSPETIRKRVDKARTHVRTDNTSGVTGVTWGKNRWMAKWNDTVLGRFENKDDAIAVRQAAERGVFPPRLTDEQRLRRRVTAALGNTNRRGKRGSEESRQRMSLAQTGRKQSPETIRKRTAWQRGTKRPESFGRAISAGKKGKPSTNPEQNLGSRNGMSKLTESDVRTIHQLLREGQSRSQIASQFGISVSCISGIFVGRLWKHIYAEQGIPCQAAM